MYYSPPIERMERVELLKGSGSILFGPQTVGGVLNYVTADAPVTPSGTMQLQRGTGGLQLLKGSYGGSWDNTRASLHYFQKSTRDLSGLELSATDLTGKLGVKLGNSDAGVKFSAYDEVSNATYVGLTDSLYNANAYQVVAPNDRLRVSRYAATASHATALGSMAFLRTTAYSYETTRNWQRQDYTYNSTGNSIEFRNSTGNRNRTFKVAGVEPRLQLGWGNSGHELDAGVRVHYEWARDQQINGQTASSSTGVIRDDEARTGNALSAFVQNRFRVGNSWQFTPGVRFEHFTFERHIMRTRVRRTSGSATTNNPEDVDLRNSDTVAEFVPGVGASFTPSSMVHFFGGVHRGFAPPRTKDALVYENPTLSPDAQVPVPVSLQLDAERSWNWEFGTRLTPRPYLSVEATTFMLDFSNQIIEPSLSGGTPSQLAFANQGRTRHTGAEVGASLDIGMLTGASHSLLLSGSYSIVNAEFSAERVMVGAGGGEVDVNGNRLPYAPEHTAQFAADFMHPAGVGLRFDVVNVGSQFTDNFETVAGTANGRSGIVPAYTVMNVAGSYELPFATGFELTASVRNLTDRKYIVSRRPEGIRVGTPQVVTAGLRLQF
jgi:Fe(3+) dicitrate transport protein